MLTVQLGDAQGSVRDNLDPMGRHSDRELIAVLKSTRLWDILCGVSLSQSKGLARAAGAPGSAPQPPRSASRPIQPTSPAAASVRAGAPACETVPWMSASQSGTQYKGPPLRDLCEQVRLVARLCLGVPHRTVVSWCRDSYPAQT